MAHGSTDALPLGAFGFFGNRLRADCKKVQIFEPAPRPRHNLSSPNHPARLASPHARRLRMSESQPLGLRQAYS